MIASSAPPVVIVGAGMAGLSCAVYLRKAWINAVVLDAADGVGGRVRTDELDGFRLDRGFQILLTAYPEARRLFDYDALDLRTFRSGALIRNDVPNPKTSWLTLLNPFREPTGAPATLLSPFGTLLDKLRIAGLLRHTAELPLDELFRQPPQTTFQFLHERGFSDQIIHRFFRPFFGGVFLEDALTTSSNFFEFCFRMFFAGDAAVPTHGISALADQLAGRLSPGQIRLKTLVRAVEPGRVTLDSGETLTAAAVVLAVDAAEGARLLGRPALPVRAFNHTTCTYFAAPESPNHQRLLMLNPQRSSAVHNVAVMSDVAPGYAPGGQSLVSVSTQGLETVSEAALTERIRRELTGWFGASVAQWRHLRTYHLPHALPTYTPAEAGTDALRQPLQLADGLYQCGDQTAYPSLNAALLTGRLVAERILASPRSGPATGY